MAEKSHISRLVEQIEPGQMREVCKVRNLVLDGNVPAPEFVALMDKIRQRYIEHNGLENYIRDMLGRGADVPSLSCVAHCRDGTLVVGANGQKVIEFLAARFGQDALPDKLELNNRRTNGSVDRMTLAI